MKKIIIILLFTAAAVFPQHFTVVKTEGNVRALKGTGENFVNVKTGDRLEITDVLVTAENSFVMVKKDENTFVLEEMSALSLNGIKKMSIDELLLALAMDDIMNAPREKNKNKSVSTAVYGTKASEKNFPHIKSNDYGIKRLNGAVQLAEKGYKESAVVFAKETFRKHPSTKTVIPFRLYFANILLEKKLYEEAYAEYKQLEESPLNPGEKKEVDEKLAIIERKLLK